MRIPDNPQYPDFSQKGQSIIAFCGLFLSRDESNGAGDTEPEENGTGDTVATGGEGAGVGEDPVGVRGVVIALYEYTTADCELLLCRKL